MFKRLIPAFPNDVNIAIMPKLGFFDLLHGRQVSKRWRNFILEDPVTCKKLFILPPRVQNDPESTARQVYLRDLWDEVGAWSVQGLGEEKDFKIHPLLKNMELKATSDDRTITFVAQASLVRDSSNVVGLVGPEHLLRRMFLTSPPRTHCLVEIGGPWMLGTWIEERWILEDRKGLKVFDVLRFLSRIGSKSAIATVTLNYGNSAETCDRMGRDNLSAAGQEENEYDLMSMSGIKFVKLA